MRDDDPLPHISKWPLNYAAELARLVSIVTNKIPPPTPTFWKKVDENQVRYFIWPKPECDKHNIIHSSYLTVTLCLVSQSTHINTLETPRK